MMQSVCETTEPPLAGNELDLLVQRMVKLCQPIGYDEEKCKGLVLEYLREAGWSDGTDLTFRLLQIVGSKISQMEIAAAKLAQKGKKKEKKHDPLAVGEWVICKSRYGIVDARPDNKVQVVFGDGFTCQALPEECKPSAPAMYYESIKAGAEKFLNWDEGDLKTIHKPIANGREMMSLAVLSELDAKVTQLIEDALLGKRKSETEAETVQAQPDSTYDAVWDTVEETAGQIDGDIFAQFGEGSFEQDAKYGPLDLSGFNLPAYAKEFDVVPERLASGKCSNPECKGTSAGGTCKCDLVTTEAGTVDPETGELIEQSFIMRKFGWTAMPTLPATPSAEQLDQFEAQLDQVVDKILGHKEQVERWRAACAARCKPFDQAIEFWTEFLMPSARLLAKYRLRRYKSGKNAGKYAEKTLKTASGGIKFTATGGFYVHDKKLVQEYIATQGVENFKAINARTEIAYDYTKLLAALKNDTLKDVPGTGKKDDNELGRVEVVSPKAPAKPEVSEDGED